MVRAIHKLAYAALLAVALGKQMVRVENGGQVSRLMRKSQSDLEIDSTQQQAAAVPADTPANANANVQGHANANANANVNANANANTNANANAPSADPPAVPADPADTVAADTAVPADKAADPAVADTEHAETVADHAEIEAEEAQEEADKAKVEEEAHAPVATVDENAAKADASAEAAEAGAEEAKEEVQPEEVDATATVDAEAATAEKEAKAADAEATAADAIADEAAAAAGGGEGAAEADAEWQQHLDHLDHLPHSQEAATNLHHSHRELTYHYMEERLPSACHSHYEDLGTHLTTGECAQACFESVGCERFSAGGCSLGCRISVVGQNAPPGSPAAEHGQCPTHAAVEAGKLKADNSHSSGGDAGQCVVYKLTFYHATSAPGVCQSHYELVDGVNANDKAHCAHACKNTPGCTRFSAGPECEAGGCRISKCGSNDGDEACPADEQCTIGVESGCAMYEVFR